MTTRNSRYDVPHVFCTNRALTPVVGSIALQGFLAAQTYARYGGKHRIDWHQRKMTAVPRKPRFADKTERYQHFQYKAAVGRQLLEHFLRVYDPPAFRPLGRATCLPQRLASELHLFQRAHLDYFRLRRHGRLVCDGPTQLAHHVLSADLCNLSPAGACAFLLLLFFLL
jgi:hypothetical protein